MRERLKQLSQSERRTRSLRVCEKLDPLFFGKNSLGLFAPMPTEPDVDLLWSLGLVASHRVSYPRCEDDALSFRRVSALTELVPGRFGIREPEPGPGLKELDLILVPGLAFTIEGSRLGRGAGFYDKFLSRTARTTLKVGICFEFQLVAEIPDEPHDVRMDAIVYA
jgi:5-formyltetrahydrofolate cyclo-ligase